MAVAWIQMAEPELKSKLSELKNNALFIHLVKVIGM